MPNSNIDLELVVDAYIECALWADLPEGDKHVALHPSAYKKCLEDVNLFLKAVTDAGIVLTLTDDEVGHDFWLTRNHHGTGFWDRGLGELGAKLSEIAQTFRELSPVVGDDGYTYIE